MKKLVALTFAVLSMNLVHSQETEFDKFAVFEGCEGILSEEENWKCFTDKTLAHIATNFEYPELARHMGIQGEVVVDFVIEKDGKVSEVGVSQSVDELLDNEAIRLIKLLPQFTPAQKDGQFISIEISVPINFVLEGDDADSKENLSFIELIVNERTETRYSSSLEAYTFEKGNADFVQTMRFVNDENRGMTSIRFLKEYYRVDSIYDESLELIATDTVKVSRDPVLLSFPFFVTQEEAFKWSHRIDTTIVDGRKMNTIIIDTVFRGFPFWVNLERYMEITYLKHTVDTLYLEVDFNRGYSNWFGRYTGIGGNLNDFEPLFNLNCNFLNLSFDDIISDIKNYSGEELVTHKNELLTIKLSDDFLYYNIDAAKTISNSYFFYEVVGMKELKTSYQKELTLPSDIPEDISIRLIPSSAIKNMPPIEYVFDIEPIQKFLGEKTSW